MNKLLMLALGAVTVLSSCSKDDSVIQDETGTKSLAMSVDLGNKKTKAEADPAGEVSINSLKVKVYSAGGTQLGSDVTIGAATTPALGDIVNGSIADDDIKRVIVEKVNSTAAYVEIRGYNNETAPAWETLSAIDARTVNQIQGYAFQDIPFITTTGTNGMDNINKTADLNANDRKVWEVSASIKPYLARFEVSGTPKLVKLDGNTPVTDATITVNNIYMNNVGNKTGSLILKGNTGGHWTHEGGKITGTTGDWEASYYTDLSAMHGVAPGANKVQAFNLWPQGMPHVILKVTVTPDGKTPYTGFVTIKNFSGAASIVNGNIYAVNLDDLSLKYDSNTGGGDIDPNPEDTEADLHLKVTVMNWVRIVLTPSV